MSHKRNIVISADHRGNCTIVVNFVDDYGIKKITINAIVSNLPNRGEIIKELQTQLETLYNGHKPPERTVLVINNKVLDEYIKKELPPKAARGYYHYGSDSKLPDDNTQNLYKLRCALDEDILQAGNYLDQIEMELGQIEDIPIVNSHLLRCLIFCVELYLYQQSSVWDAAANIAELGL